MQPVMMQNDQRRSYKHICEHVFGDIQCTKRTKALFCENHQPICKSCGKKCRKFEDLENVYCFKHSQYHRDKIREHVARSRERKRDRKLAVRELMAVIYPVVNQWLNEYCEDVGYQRWIEYIDWLQGKHPEDWDIYNKVVRAIREDIENLSGDDLRIFVIGLVEELRIMCDGRLDPENDVVMEEFDSEDF